MKVIKIAAVFACSFLIALLFLIIKVENPEIALYKKTVKMLMQQEGVVSEQEIEERFPILIGIQTDMKEVAELNQFILSKTQNPAPVLTEAETIQLEHSLQKINKLRQEVRTELTQLMPAYAASQP